MIMIFLPDPAIRSLRARTLLSKHLLAFLAALIFLLGCSDEPPSVEIKPKGARLTAKEVIRIAKKEADRRGIDLRDFKEPQARYRLPAGNSWGVFFDGRDAAGGKNFLIFVDDRTEEARYFPGR
jgi:hypothetical protein